MRRAYSVLCVAGLLAGPAATTGSAQEATPGATPAPTAEAATAPTP